MNKFEREQLNGTDKFDVSRKFNTGWPKIPNNAHPKLKTNSEKSKKMSSTKFLFDE